MRRILTSLSITLCICTGASGNGRYAFRNFSQNDGLSQSTVRAVAEDRLGNIWLGTRNGLNIYDGYRFRTFHADLTDSTAISDDSIYALMTDSEGTIWIGTTSALSCYDFRMNRFRNYPLPAEKHHILSISDSGENLILSSETGLLIFDKGNKIFEPVPALDGHTIRSMIPTEDGSLAASKQGLIRIYGKDSPGLWKAESVRGFEDYDISAIEPVHGGPGYWIATHGHGLFRTGEDFEKLAHYGQADKLPSDYIRVLETDVAGRLWIGTYDGLAIYDGRSGDFSIQKHSSERNSLSHNSIWSIFMDSQGGVWAGTYFGGVNYYNSHADRFRTIPLPSTEKNPVYGFVSCMLSEGDDIWAGTNDDGIFRYSPLTGTFRRYYSGSVSHSGKMSDNIKCLLPDGDGGLYAGTHLGGLCRIDTQSGRAEIFAVNERFPINNGCYSLLDEGNGTLWVGTPSGLYEFDKETKAFSKHMAAVLEPRLSALLINYLFRDSSGKVWIGTDSGLFCMDRNGRSVRFFDTVAPGIAGKDIYVYHITETSDGSIWAGTDKGLLRYGDSQAVFTASDGLPNNQVFSILERGQELWISTGGGICVHDRSSGTFRTVRPSESFYENEFTPQACAIGQDGSFYFGGLRGITAFLPSEISPNPFSPTPYFSEVEIPKGKKQAFTERNRYGSISRLRLSSATGTLRIRFSVGNPLSAGNNTFFYKLEKPDTDWNETSGREISYSHLAPGKYTLRLKAANNDALLSEGEEVMSIRILPQWWQTVWAGIFFILAAAGAVAAMIWYYISRVRMRMQLKMGMERLDSFIELSHSLRTPLTLILSPLQEIEKRGQQDRYTRTRLGFIRRSSMKLLHIVNQMLEYRRVEQGLQHLHVQTCSPEVIAGECFSLFEDEAEKRGLDYIFNSELHSESFPVDKDILEMILMNLVGTSFRLTPRNGTISLTLTKENGSLRLSLACGGDGIGKEKLDGMLENFAPAGNGGSGMAISLALVKKLVDLHHGRIEVDGKEGQYSRFIISLPASEVSYSAQELTPPEKALTGNTRQESLPLYLSEVSGSEDVYEGGQAREEEAPKASLLIVAHDNELLNYMVSNFQEFKVLTARSIRQAQDVLRDSEPDVIIADNALPDGSGLKLCQSVKRNVKTCHIQFIMLTAKDDASDKLSSIEAGADATIAQPFSMELLLASVNNILKSRDRLRHRYSCESEIDPQSVTSNSLDGEFLRKAIEVVEANIDNDAFSSEDFAKAMCMSRSNLYLKITSITGASAAKFIRKIRFNKACQLLLERKYSIAEISAKVGFNSPSYFATSFKKHMGCLPTEYGKGFPSAPPDPDR